jgi:hypothetical protein
MDAVFFTYCKETLRKILLPSHNLNLGCVGVFWRMPGDNSFAKLAVIVARCFGEEKCAKNDR